MKLLRQIKGIGQKDLADKLNVSPKTISHWETGYTEPTISQLIAISYLFEITIDELVGKIGL